MIVTHHKCMLHRELLIISVYWNLKDERWWRAQDVPASSWIIAWPTGCCAPVTTQTKPCYRCISIAFLIAHSGLHRPACHQRGMDWNGQNPYCDHSYWLCSSFVRLKSIFTKRSEDSKDREFNQNDAESEREKFADRSYRSSFGAGDLHPHCKT